MKTIVCSGGLDSVKLAYKVAAERRLTGLQRRALQGLARIDLYTPFLRLSKADIVHGGREARSPVCGTWSCYEGGSLHCGRCGTCVERREAFHLAGIEDPTPYADPDDWVEACREHQARRPS